jgi:hypothetical protein
MKSINKLLYIITFIALYAGTALVSTLHAFSFFQMSNTSWIAGLLAVCFELGQAAVLFSILTTKAERGKILPWVLMSILTIVQIIGNVFASYKYIMTHSLDNLKYFKDPIFVWMDMPDTQSTVILTYIASAILPIVALAMTAMITSFLNNDDKTKDNKKEVQEVDEKPPEDDVINDINNKQETNIKDNIITDSNPVPLTQLEEDGRTDDTQETNITDTIQETTDDLEDKDIKDLKQKTINNLNHTKQTHLVSI